MTIRNNKGIFFTIIVIVILSLFILSYSLYSGIQERKAIQKRIETMNSFINSIEADLGRKLFTSGFRIIFLFEKDILDTGQYILTDFNQTIEAAFINGTILGKTNPEIEAIMQGAKYSDILSDIQQTGSKININISLLSNDFWISQDDPWHVKVVLDANLSIRDQSNLASWSISKTFIQHIPIFYFNDPLYIVNTNGKILHNITKTPYLGFTDINDFNDHINKTYYTNSTEAPSFIDRLTGSNSPSANGIESLVSLQKLSEQGITVPDKSIVDHIYFSSANPSNCHISGALSWVKLDEEHRTNLYSSLPCG